MNSALHSHLLGQPDRRYLGDLLPFVESARSGSFSAAARKLQLTPSAVSKSIARLEKALDARLFLRSTRQLELTAEGQMLLDRIDSAFASVDEAIDALHEARQEPAGLVRVSVLAAFGRLWVMPLLQALMRQHPKLDIELQLDDGTADLIADRFDLAIRRGPLRAQNSVARHLGSLPLVLVASPAYLSERGVPRHPSDLAEHDCVSVRFPSGRRAKWVFRGLASASSPTATHIEPRGRLVLSEQPADALVDAAVAGFGITAIAASFVLPQLQRGELKLLLPDYQLGSPVEMYLQYPDRAHLPMRVRVVADYLQAQLQNNASLRVGPAELRDHAA